jgi:hypothetical protein
MKLRHIPRWVVASVHKHFDANRDNVVLYLEGQDRTPTNEMTEHFELRVDGPHQDQQTQSEWIFYVEVSLLITSHKDRKDSHKMQRLLGIALEAMQTCIPVYKYGDGPDDDKSQLGVLIRVDTSRDPTDVSNFGQIEPTAEIEQGTVAGNYRMCL